MTEKPPISNQGEPTPVQPETPDESAFLAYTDLDVLIGMWAAYHPNAADEDVDKAVERFKTTISKRDNKPTEE